VSCCAVQKPASERIRKSHQSLFRRSAANARHPSPPLLNPLSLVEVKVPSVYTAIPSVCTLLPAKSNSYCLKHHLLTMKFLVAPMAALAGMASLVFAEEVRQNEKRRAKSNAWHKDLTRLPFMSQFLCLLSCCAVPRIQHDVRSLRFIASAAAQCVSESSSSSPQRGGQAAAHDDGTKYCVL
jgi:hypothetical protein